VRALIDPGAESGVPHGDVLVAFAEGVVQGDDAALADARAALVQAMGAAAMVDAAGVASNFERMVRIADATGIELGAYLENVTTPDRERLGVSRPHGR